MRLAPSGCHVRCFSQDSERRGRRVFCRQAVPGRLMGSRTRLLRFTTNAYPREKRREAWRFMLAGGGLEDHLDRSCTTTYENGIASPVTVGGGGPALRRQLGILRWFLQELPLVRCAPQTSFITGGWPACGPHEGAPSADVGLERQWVSSPRQMRSFDNVRCAPKADVPELGFVLEVLSCCPLLRTMLRPSRYLGQASAHHAWREHFDRRFLAFDRVKTA